MSIFYKRPSFFVGCSGRKVLTGVGKTVQEIRLHILLVTAKMLSPRGNAMMTPVCKRFKGQQFMTCYCNDILLLCNHVIMTTFGCYEVIMFFRYYCLETYSSYHDKKSCFHNNIIMS
jgi:hypothetical protein